MFSAEPFIVIHRYALKGSACSNTLSGNLIFYLTVVNYNRGTYLANLTEKPSLTTTRNGEDVANFRIAINCGGKKGSEETATFVDVEAYAGLARLCSDKLKAGSLVLIEARLKSTDWDNGTKSKVFLRADNIQFLDFTK